MKRFRIQLLIALIVLICGMSLMGIVYLVFNKPEVYINPGVVVTNPSPVATPIQPMNSGSSMRTNYPYSYSAYPMPFAMVPQAAMQPSRGLFVTSNAQTQSVGGGAGYGTATSSGSDAQRGIIYTTSSVTTIVSLAANRQVAEPAAQFAPEMATLVSAPRRAPGPPTPGELDPEHQLPLGAPWALAVLAALYAVVRKRKEDAE